MIAAGEKTVRRRRVDTRKEQQLLFQPFCVHHRHEVCLLRRTRGHCANVAPRGVMNVSAGELWSTEVRKVNLSLVFSGLSMHTIK